MNKITRRNEQPMNIYNCKEQHWYLYNPRISLLGKQILVCLAKYYMVRTAKNVTILLIIRCNTAKEAAHTREQGKNGTGRNIKSSNRETSLSEQIWSIVTNQQVCKNGSKLTFCWASNRAKMNCHGIISTIMLVDILCILFKNGIIKCHANRNNHGKSEPRGTRLKCCVHAKGNHHGINTVTSMIKQFTQG